MAILVLLRHGQSLWNQENKFTGWVDVELSEKGVAEAARAGQLLKAYHFNRVFTSPLKRAIDTAQIVLRENGQTGLSLEKSPALNERNYGDLQGLNKDDVRKKLGIERVHSLRRSYNERPPNGESLKDTSDRVIPYFQAHILPALMQGETVLVAAHGNSLRGLVKFLDHLSDEAVTELEIPTGVPIVYDLNSQGNVIHKGVLQ